MLTYYSQNYASIIGAGLSISACNKLLLHVKIVYLIFNALLCQTSIDVVPSKNQALCKYIMHVSDYTTKVKYSK